uniref:Uncharacterized protein n=1 Tax=Chaetoceros debilis TaxID=122233 RepID=A0A7S3QBD0_9STRA
MNAHSNMNGDVSASALSAVSQINSAIASAAAKAVAAAPPVMMVPGPASASFSNNMNIGAAAAAAVAAATTSANLNMNASTAAAAAIAAASASINTAGPRTVQTTPIGVSIGHRFQPAPAVATASTSSQKAVVPTMNAAQQQQQQQQVRHHAQAKVQQQIQQQAQQQNATAGHGAPGWSVPNPMSVPNPLAMLMGGGSGAFEGNGKINGNGNGNCNGNNGVPAAVPVAAPPTAAASVAAAVAAARNGMQTAAAATTTAARPLGPPPQVQVMNVGNSSVGGAAHSRTQPQPQQHHQVQQVQVQVQAANFQQQLQHQAQVQAQQVIQAQAQQQAQVQHQQVQVQPTPVAVRVQPHVRTAPTQVPINTQAPGQVRLQPQQHQQQQQLPVAQQVKPGVIMAGSVARPGVQGVRRKLVLTPEGRDALTKAVLSSLKNPSGQMDPAMLQRAMQITKLSQQAILNAAKMAKTREQQKKLAAAASARNEAAARAQAQAVAHAQAQAQARIQAQAQAQAQVHARAQAQVQAQAQARSQAQAQHRVAPQAQAQANHSNIVRSNTGVMVLSGGAVTGGTVGVTGPMSSATTGTVYRSMVSPQHSQNQAVKQQLRKQQRQTSQQQTQKAAQKARQAQLAASASKAANQSSPASIAKAKANAKAIAYMQQQKQKQLQLQKQQDILRKQQQQKQQKQKEIRARAQAAHKAAVVKEASKWGRIQDGIFTKGSQVRSYRLGAVTRCPESNSIVSKQAKNCIELRAKTKPAEAPSQEMWMKILEIQSQMKRSGNGTSSPTNVTAIPKSKPRRFENATLALTDVTDKSKRLKLQPRKESRYLEKNLRKHRQVHCDTLSKKLKEMNKQIMSHSSEFYKFHRARKLDISKFARSMRDHVALQARKKEKGAVNEEKARILALKANDMQAYTALVQDTRNDRLKFLLNKTDQYIDQISGLLQDQNTGEGAGDGEGSGDGEVSGDGGDGANSTAVKTDDEEGGVEVVGGSRIIPVEDEAAASYYQTAHVRQEEVKQPSILLGGQLKEYQVAGLKWLVSLYNNKLNGILADEMGLGKTVQTIALIAHLMETKDNRGPYLVIVPLSTLSNWVNEFVKWCPSATVIVYKGTPAQRKGLFKASVRGGHFNVLLTTYEYIIKDKSSLRKLHWEYAIVDEGHRMKNAQSKFAVTLGTQYETKHRILLTGTPLQNSLPELWALLNFLLPSVFNSVETFDQWFNKPFAQFGTKSDEGDAEEVVSTEERLLIIQRLHELLRPFMLRRIKADVLDQLPDKVEKVLRCELSSWQKELYKQISYSVLENGEKKSKRGLNNVVMQLRKVCNHPYMFTPEGYYITEDLIRTSGKVELLDRMLPKLKAAGHRILMFFQMTAAMTIVEDYFKYRGILSLRLDGSTTGEERERRMDLFNAPNSPYFIFMLSTRAGGLGLNLVSADTVIIFDSDWNPMMDLQAQDRAHRIGQKKIVSVFRLITNSPVEEKILSRATEKLNMSEIIVEAGKFDKTGLKEDGAEERHKMMEILLTDFSTSTKDTGNATGSLPESDDEDGPEEKEDLDVNELLSRNDEDFEFYSKMDSGEVKDPDFFHSPGLFTDPDDVPDWIKHPNSKEDKDVNEDGILLEPGQRRKAAKSKTYDDGLTEKQFLRIMEKQAKDEEDAAKARKKEWKDKRDKTAAAVAASLAATEAESSESSTLTPVIFDRLVSMTKSIIAIRDKKTKRRHSDIFRDQPSKDEYPEYFRAVEKPIAINDIMKKCREKNYTSVRGFHEDWLLMFDNAKKFNGETSWIAFDADVLKAELDRLLSKYKILEEQKKPEPDAPTPKKKKPRIKLSLKKLSTKRKKDNGTKSASPAKKRQKRGA